MRTGEPTPVAALTWSGVIARRMARRCEWMSIPRTRPCPESMVISPSRVRIIVVLPAPLGPSRPIAPSGSDTDRPRSADTLP